MLKKMRWRFVLAAMSSFAAVILILVCAVNLWNYNISTGRQDSVLEMLLEAEPRPSARVYNAPDDFHVPGPFGGHSREARFMTRFFVVYYDKNGIVTDINHDNIASVSAEEAESYANDVLKNGRKKGYYKNYRYRIDKTNGSLAFLNSEREIQYMKTLFLVSGIIALCSLALVFVLVLIFSGRAIAPYIRNIETQKRFITDAGHELKTPLTSISASADILAMEYSENEWVKNIRKQSARMSKLISGLVRLSRLDEEQSASEKTNFSLSEAIWEISEPAAAAAAVKGKEYTQNIEDGIMFYGDRTAIQQMISELLENALKYSDNGGKINLTVLRRHKKIEINVRNTCSSIESIDTKKIFDRFYRSDKTRGYSEDSFGIGLATVKAVVENHHGTISVHKIDGSEILFIILF